MEKSEELIKDNNQEIVINDKIIEDEYQKIIKEKESETIQWKNKYMYTLSDFENYKRNAIKEKQNLSKYANEKIIKEIIPIIDDFDRAFTYINNKDKEGFMLIYNKFITILNRYNVSVIDPDVEEEFNDEIHEAVSTIPNENKRNTIAECIEKGYMLNDKVIRYAKVVVFT